MNENPYQSPQSGQPPKESAIRGGYFGVAFFIVAAPMLLISSLLSSGSLAVFLAALGALAIIVGLPLCSLKV